jgi:hypothetical protein
VWTIFVPGDEIVLAVWRGDDADAVRQAIQAVGLPLDRISLARELTITGGQQ